MQIRFNLTLSAFVVIIFLVSSFNAKSVSLQNPVGDNRSSPDKPSAKQSSNINLSTSCIDAVEKSTVDVTENNTLAMSLVSTTTVSSPANITTETSTSNNISATTISERTDKDTTTFQKSIEETTMVQEKTITSVETVTENKISTDRTTESGLLDTRYIIRFHTINRNALVTMTTCRDGKCIQPFTDEPST
uniref:Uncharacterized protein n=1 Tax=Schizaphis graminum TaxID=13262 RepID=A0A2S2NZ23_SCHGA